MEQIKNQRENRWHALEKEAVFERLGASDAGLEENEVKHRLRVFGPNTLQLKYSDTVLRILLRQLHNPIVYVLIFSTLLAFFLGKYIDSFVVFGAVVLNTLIGFIQEYRAHQTIRALSAMIPQQVTVLRGGSRRIVSSSEIVPGDVVVLEAGDRIAADMRLFETKNLRCDESTLTGESLPVDKNGDTCSDGALIFERPCMVFNGTYITAGSGLGIVVETGMRTEFGKISALVAQVLPHETPLSIVVKKIAQGITIAVLAVSLGLFLIGYLRGSSLFDAAFAAIVLAVAAIPEGVPAIITIASSIGVRRMARRHAVIRHLPAVEALGSASIICTDKTGTLTYNEMTVQKVWTPRGFSTVSGSGYSTEGRFAAEDKSHLAEIAELMSAAIVCSEATFGKAPIGDPTEIALLVAGRKMGLSEGQLRSAWKRLDVIPFDSERRTMATLNIAPSEQRYILIKGAPEAIAEICRVNPDQIHAHIQSMAKEGMRVLGVARKEIASSTSHLQEAETQDGCHFLGLIGMIDPPRKEAYHALKACEEAGIVVKMVTGDHPLTAEAISRDLGILRQGTVITGAEFSAFTDEERQRAVKNCHVFARISPEHKLKLVEVLQGLGAVVAMTGDGVNDGPALKRADIGIAMGIKGTAVAKEAADMVLADDNFASIEAAVEEGRRVYDNLLKSLMFVLPASLGQALVIFFAVLFFPIREGVLLYPMSPVQILWVNLVIAVALSLSLAFESAEPDIMTRPPRKKTDSVLSLSRLIKILIVSAVMAIGAIGLFLWEYHSKVAQGEIETRALAEAQTIAVTALILFQIFYLFNCRSLRHSIVKPNFFSNPFIFIGAGGVLAAQAAFIYLPFMQRLFSSASLDLGAWLVSALVASSILLVDYLLNLYPEKSQ